MLDDARVMEMRDIDRECAEGYRDGRDGGLVPGDNRSAAYRHGYWNGRDDRECSRGERRFPRRTAAESRAAWAQIEAQQIN